MKNVRSVLILDEKGKELFFQQHGPQGSTDVNTTLFTNLINALQMFVKDIGEKHLERLELDDYKVFIARNENLRLSFIVQTEINIKDKKMFKLLGQIEKVFLKKYGKYLKSPEKIRMHILGSFKKDLDKILGQDIEKRVGNFLDSL
ncbi:MAG: hypothetical protein ACTSRW_12010 [Candidatus Helarchaeota archaeon]